MKDLIPAEKSWQPLLPGENDHVDAGQLANLEASRQRFNEYRLRRADQTLRRQEADLNLFITMLEALSVPCGDLARDPEAWRGITWGLVEAFIKWQLKKGYAVPSVNVRLSTVKVYARLAMQSGTMPSQEYALIRSVASYSQREQRRIDQRRPTKRIGVKKAEPVLLTLEQANQLKHQPETPQGRRDRVMLCLLLDHGLRVGELVGLDVSDLDLETGMLRFYRPKVAKEQTHRLSTDALAALRTYRAFGDMPEQGSILRRSLKDDSLAEGGMTDRAVTKRVNVLGERIGVFGLSAHDCRHYWATTAARKGTDPFDLQQAGGWASLAMPRRYVEDNDIANEGVILD